jgi:CheY-like chemotaxis protein
LLAFSRRQELKPESVDVAHLVHGMEELLKRALGNVIELKLQFPGVLPPVLADANQLELALLNVALNARDAMPASGRLTIAAEAATVGAERSDPSLRPGDYVLITVADTGIGMDEVTLAKATEPFFTTKGPGKGTGLGLSMVHGLAAQSGGRLRIRSRLYAGTVVELWLPRARTPCVSVARPPAAAAPALTVKPCNVLVVDDDLLVMTGTSAMLEDLGHTAIEAHSGTEALVKLASGVAVDVMITDHAMPGMTGLQLAAHVQERFPLCGIARGPRHLWFGEIVEALQPAGSCRGHPGCHVVSPKPARRDGAGRSEELSKRLGSHGLYRYQLSVNEQWLLFRTNGPSRGR